MLTDADVCVSRQASGALGARSYSPDAKEAVIYSHEFVRGACGEVRMLTDADGC
jgi:hypothetical protein